ncbi:HigA family addiction module antitoxin [Paenarthrobacter histidinolovorans]|uniref:HigA family addiction module antitoxin n=1 Tax=Paenarthrobacter histidinolovorans TaxID=43664 RepID=UPI0016696DDB|nr:HigA family addiction module antitoxin [Paenarthrobacter histidinolovorans]
MMTTYTATDPQFDFAPQPGRWLQRELDHQAISQAQLAARTGLSTKHINLVIKGTAALSPEVAVTLEQILGTSAETWLHMEAERQIHQARKDRNKALSRFVEWANSFPRQLLIDRRVIQESDVGPELAAKLLDFFSVASPSAYAKTWLEPQASYKRSQIHSIDPDLTALWLRLSELHAADLIENAPAYDAAKLKVAAEVLPKLTINENVADAFTEAQQLLLATGVVLVFVSEIPNTRISGVSRWINGTPMIAVTSRYKALDSLWFTILHEIAHVLLHPKRSTFIDGFKADDDSDAQETAANEFAQNHLIPVEFREQLTRATTERGILSLAKTLGVAPSLVAGQWAFKTGTWGGPIAKLRKKLDLTELLG